MSNRHCSHCDDREGPAKDAYFYLFAQLAERVPLLELDWKMTMSRGLIEQTLKATPHPFCGLQSLKCSATNSSARMLLPCLSTLQCLDLTLEAPSSASYWGANIDRSFELSSIAQCTRLQDLKIDHTCHNTSITMEELLDLAGRCSRLQRLILCASSESFSINSADIHDASMEILASLLPNIRELKLQIKSDLSTQSLLSLTKHCPSLKILELGGNFDLSLLRFADDVLFPTLRNMSIEHFKRGANSSAITHAAIMYYHAPKMSGLSASCTPADEAVEKAHRRLRENPGALLLKGALDNIGKVKRLLEIQ